MIKIQPISEATEWDKKQLWEPDEGLKSKLINQEVSLLNAKFFKIGETLVISQSHGDRLQSKKDWSLYGNLYRRYDSEIERMMLSV